MTWLRLSVAAADVRAGVRWDTETCRHRISHPEQRPVNHPGRKVNIEEINRTRKVYCSRKSEVTELWSSENSFYPHFWQFWDRCLLIWTAVTRNREPSWNTKFQFRGDFARARREQKYKNNFGVKFSQTWTWLVCDWNGESSPPPLCRHFLLWIFICFGNLIVPWLSSQSNLIS